MRTVGSCEIDDDKARIDLDAHDLYRTLGFREPDRSYLERPSSRGAP